MSVTTLEPTINSAWRLDVDVSATETPDFVQVRAMSNFVPAINDTIQDASDYDSEGWGSDARTLRKWQITGTVLRKVDPADDSYDPGQEKLRSAAGDGSIVTVQFYDRTSASAEAYEGDAIVQWNPQGGDVSGLQAVNFTLLGQGARREITNPTT